MSRKLSHPSEPKPDQVVGGAPAKQAGGSFHAYPVASQIGAATEPTTYAALYNAGRRPKPLRRKTPVGN